MENFQRNMLVMLFSIYMFPFIKIFKYIWCRTFSLDLTDSADQPDEEQFWNNFHVKDPAVHLNNCVIMSECVVHLCRLEHVHGLLCLCAYLFALLFCPHLLKGSLKLPNKVMFSIRVPVPNCALKDTQRDTQTQVHTFIHLEHSWKTVT